MKSEFEISTYKAVHDLLYSDVERVSFPTAFCRRLAPPRFVLGEEFIPVYGREPLSRAIDAVSDDAEARIIHNVILAGYRLVILGHRYIVLNDFRATSAPTPDGHSEPMLRPSENGGWRLDGQNVLGLKGRYALIQWEAGRMYHHWVFECLPRMILLADDPRFRDVRFLVPSNAPAYVVQTAKYLNIDVDRIVYFDPRRAYEVETIVALPVPSFEPDDCHAGALFTVRQRVLASLARAELKTTPDKIVFTRRDALNNERQLLNEPELIESLERQGFVAITPGDHSFEDQIRMTYQASHVLCVHGSAGANMLFCRPDAKALHLFMDCVHYFHTHGIGTAVAGADYGYVFGPSFERGQRLHMNPWLLSPDRVFEALERMDNG